MTAKTEHRQRPARAGRPRTGIEIHLDSRWSLGAKMTQGGFGEIFEAASVDGQVAVVKLIPKVPGAQRELLFDLPDAPNVLPSIDRGDWGDYWVLVMPRATTSLQQRLRERQGSLPEVEAVAVLRDIANGLTAMSGKVVHRDLKPANILLWEGRWCIADFGIARYAEATTAPDTRKRAMTSAYAAPEQWRLERATEATDVYAMGVLGFELIEGRLPFPGPTAEEFRDQHLYGQPSGFKQASPPLQALLSECLLKQPQARPTARAIADRLQHITEPASGGLARLQQAYSLQVALDLVEQTKRAREADEEARRRGLYASAEQVFASLIGRFEDAVRRGAPSAKIERRGGLSLDLGQARLTLEPLKRNTFGLPNRTQPGFEVIANSKISITYTQPRGSWVGRSHSLWYSNAVDRAAYRLLELAFMAIFTKEIRPIEPFALDPNEDAFLALSPVMHTYQSAWNFTPVDQGEEGAFIDRWLGWFADAAAGSLQRPSVLPERR